MSSALATIRGISSLSEVNVRASALRTAALLFKKPVGLGSLPIMEVAPDSANEGLNGKTYQWFRLTFLDNTTGWVRDDLIEVQGDLSAFGYGTVAQPANAFMLTRQQMTGAAGNAPAPSPSPAPAQTAPPPAAQMVTPPAAGTVSFDLHRVKKASFVVTAAFEGSGYAAYNNYDAGIISYGLIQFTLAAGSLFTVVDKYLATSASATANGLRGYADRIKMHDASLRDDMNLKQLLLAAANEAEMQRAQDEVASANYWDKVVEGYITPRGLKLPLSYALLFDMGVNFGTGHKFVRMAEEQLGVPVRSRPGENGITEEQLMAKVADLRKTSHYNQAARDNLPGLKVRGDFWVTRVNKGDWNFMGDADGLVDVGGRKVQIKTP